MIPRITLSLAILLAAFSTFAQTAPEATPEGIAKMKIFAALAGDWTGPSEYTMNGSVKKSSVKEHLYTKLNGLVFIAEGLGLTKDPVTGTEKVTHNALGILSWDEVAKDYKFYSWLSDGKSTQAYWKVMDDTHFEWGFPLGENMGFIRYQVTIGANGKTWKEIGEYSQEKTTWHKFFEMNLTR